jgi:predicted N-acetyltransferase YhbS
LAEFRTLTPADLAAVHALEVEAYEPSLHESVDALARLIALFPQGAFGAFDEHGLCGFIFGVPLTRGTRLELRVPLASVPDHPDMFYVHDIAVAGRCRGQGVGRALAKMLLAVACARGFRYAELVSVQGSAPFWERFGFRAVRTFQYEPGAASVHMAADV